MYFGYGFGGILELVLLIWALWDLLSSGRFGGTNMLIWLLVIILIPVIGPILYLILGRGRAG